MAVEIIAEAAQGYEGDPSLARLLAKGAICARANAFKMQLVYGDELATPDYEYYSLFKKLEMPESVWKDLITETHANGLRFYVDIFGEKSLQVAQKLGVDGIKIHSTDFFNDRLVRTALAGSWRLFISLGGITADELTAFIQKHKLQPHERITLLYGFQGDPTPLESNHVLRLRSFTQRFPVFRFGFMDHQDGATEEAMNLSLLSLPLSVQTIEKHITLDRSLQLEDYISALEPERFTRFVQQIRQMERALGSDALELGEGEKQYRRKVTKVVVSIRPLRKGEILTAEAIALKRSSRMDPQHALYSLDQALDRRLDVDTDANQPITVEMVS